MKFLFRWVREKGGTVARLKDTPASIARGVAIGTFFGFVPLVGLKTLLSMGTAKLCRSNVIASAVAVTLHDIILPLAPLIIRWEYQLGHWVLGKSSHVPASPHTGQVESFKVDQLLHWASFTKFVAPALVGSVIVGIPFAIIGYWVAHSAVTRLRIRQAAEAAEDI